MPGFLTQGFARLNVISHITPAMEATNARPPCGTIRPSGYPLTANDQVYWRPVAVIETV
jgi:hypothetical protein